MHRAHRLRAVGCRCRTPLPVPAARATAFVPRSSFGSAGGGSDKFARKYDLQVEVDARARARGGLGGGGAGGNPAEAAMHKVAGEFQDERISATRRAESRLREELCALAELARADVSRSSSHAVTFNAKRKNVLKLRGELIIQREVVAGMAVDAANAVEREFPVPAAL